MFKHSPPHPCRQLTPLPSGSREPRSQSFHTQDSARVSVPKGCWWKIEVRGEGSTRISSFSPNTASLPQAEPGLRLLDPRLEATASSAQYRTRGRRALGTCTTPARGAPPTASPSRAAKSNLDKGWAPSSGGESRWEGRGRLRSKTQPIRNLQKSYERRKGLLTNEK